MDQYQSWGRLVTNFQGHRSIQISPGNKAQGIGPYEFLLKFIWTNGSQISLKVLVSPASVHRVLFSEKEPESSSEFEAPE